MRQRGCSKTENTLFCTLICVPLTKQVQIHDFASHFCTNTTSSPGRRQADNRASDSILPVLLRLTTDLDHDRFIWKNKKKKKKQKTNKENQSVPWWLFPRIFFSKEIGKMVSKSPPPWTSHRKAECWQDVGAPHDTIWSPIICRLWLSGWHWSSLWTFSSCCCFWLFFFFSSPIPQSGRERVVVGGCSIHS